VIQILIRLSRDLFLLFEEILRDIECTSRMEQPPPDAPEPAEDKLLDNDDTSTRPVFGPSFRRKEQKSIITSSKAESKVH